MNTNFTRLFYAIGGMTLLIGVVVMFAVDLPTGALITAVDLAVLAFVYFFFLKSIMKSERLMETGVPARAKIMSMRDTGTVINDRYLQTDFVLEVYPEKGEPYEAKTRGLVHMMRIPSYQPGLMIPVMVNPSNPQDVAIGSKDEGMEGNTATTTSVDEQRRQIEEMLDRNEKQKQEIQAKGIEAEAVVLKAFDLDINVNGPNPAMHFLLEVKPEGQAAFQAQTTGVIDESAVQKYQPGKTITIKYDPDDLNRVALFHSGGKDEGLEKEGEVTPSA